MLTSYEWKALQESTVWTTASTPRLTKTTLEHWMDINSQIFPLSSRWWIYLCLEVDPMLECFLVVQRDPQVMSIIDQVILGFCGHFQSTRYPHTAGETTGISTGNEPARFKWRVIQEKQSQIRLVHVLHRSGPSRHRNAVSPPSTAAKWRQLPHQRSANCCPANIHRNSLNNTCRTPETATCGARCVFPTFPVVSVEVGWVLPPALDPPLPHGGRVWLEESGDPTCFHWSRGTP